MATTALKEMQGAKPLDLYQADEGDSDVEIEDRENDNAHYDFDYDELKDAENLEEDAGEIDKEEERRIQQEMLFFIQGVGSIKNIENYDVYVKHAQCEHSLTDIYRRLKNESTSYPIVKLTLGDWRFLQNDLIPLLIFHKQDKKLSFLTCMLMVQLTEVP